MNEVKGLLTAEQIAFIEEDENCVHLPVGAILLGDVPKKDINIITSLVEKEGYTPSKIRYEKWAAGQMLTAYIMP